MNQYLKVRRIIADVRRGAAFVLVCGVLSGQARPPARVFCGDSAHPVASGEVWLVAHEWGYYPAALVATIRNGTLEPVPEPPPIKGAEHAYDFRLIAAISDRALPPRGLRTTEQAYTEDLLKEFSSVYLSEPLGKDQQGRDWPSALSRMGVATGQTLILPRPGRRTVRMLFPNGRPFAGARISVSLYGSDQNHCGRPAGIPVGEYQTDRSGRITFTATLGPLALHRSYYSEERAGPAGVRFVLKDGVITGPGPDITENRWWNLSLRSYAVTLRTSAGKPLAGVRLSGCLCNEVCGAVCGPIPLKGAASSRSGLLRFDNQDLRSMEKITLTSATGEERALSESDLLQLMTTHRLAFTWK